MKNRNFLNTVLSIFSFVLLLSSCNKLSPITSELGDNGSSSRATASIAITSMPTNVEVGKKATFGGTCSNVYKYIASSDGFILKEEVVSGKTSWSFQYTFNTAGNRKLLINAFDINGKIIATDTENFVVNPAGGGGNALSEMIMRRCANIAPYNRPYSFDGVGDCWGYVRQVWNAVLHDGREHTEDYNNPNYNKTRWCNGNMIGGKYLPVADYVSTNWKKVTNWNDMPKGVPLSSHQGHKWGDDWHGAIYAGKNSNGSHMMWDCSGRSSRNGAYYRPISESPKISNGYYYVPLYNRLKGR
ncbi:MAG: hypothetical protein MUC49_16300 [Raineya sp.]|jgi:hypothetical protein|nr:hypothetical protein [Raineya sp.]